MNKLARPLAALLLSLSMAACSSADSAPDTTEDTDEVSEAITLADIVGRWQFVYDDDRRAAVEARITENVLDPGQRAKAIADADAEAKASHIEFTQDGIYVSRIGDEEIFRSPRMKIARTDGRTMHVEGSKDGKPMSIAITLVNDDQLVMTDPRKGDLTFSRIR